MDERGRVTARERFLESIGEKLRENWDKDSSVEGNMDVMMCNAAKGWLGHEDIRQPDWFRENEVDLKSVCGEKQAAHPVAQHWERGE